MPAKNGIIIQCHYCGSDIYRAPWRLKRTPYQFCDSACRGKWQSTFIGESARAYKGTLQNVACECCGKIVERDPTKVERNEHFFCSRDCYHNWRIGKLSGPNNPNWTESIKTQCATCGTPIERNPGRVGTEERKVHFCSMDCKYSYMSEYLSGENNYNWKGGPIDYYGPNWYRQRRKARARDNGICQHCGITQDELGQSLDVHHIQPFRTFNYVTGENDNYKEANKLSNLISLCRSCHIREEHSIR